MLQNSNGQSYISAMPSFDCVNGNVNNPFMSVLCSPDGFRIRCLVSSLFLAPCSWSHSGVDPLERNPARTKAIIVRSNRTVSVRPTGFVLAVFVPV